MGQADRIFGEGYALLTVGQLRLKIRLQEVILYHDLKFGRIDPMSAQPEHTIDISQSLGRVPGCFGGLPCITPAGKPFLRKRFRLMTAAETLSAQGLPLMSQAQLSPFKNKDSKGILIL